MPYTESDTRSWPTLRFRSVITEIAAFIERTLSRTSAQPRRNTIPSCTMLMRALEFTPTAVILVDREGRIQEMNRAARSIFRVPENVNVIARSLEDALQHEPCAATIRRAVQRDESELVEPDTTHPVPERITLKSCPDRVFQMRVGRICDDASCGNCATITLEEVTDIDESERAKSDFVSVVAHELANPLTPMRGFLRMLIDDHDDQSFTPEERHEFYSILDENAARLERLVHDLLCVSRVERLGADGIDMNWNSEVEVHREVKAAVTAHCRTSMHTVTIDFDPEEITVETDPDRFQEILQNLISNAIKYSPRGGEVRITGRIEPPTEHCPTGSLLLGVQDQGDGIPRHLLMRLGEKFYRVPRSENGPAATGTGIGLFLVKYLVAAHHGEVWAESDGPGCGATFWVRLPKRQPESEIDHNRARERRLATV